MEGDPLGLLGGIADLRGDVYPLPDLAALPTSSAPMSTLPVDMQCTLGVLVPNSEDRMYCEMSISASEIMFRRTNIDAETRTDQIWCS